MSSTNVTIIPATQLSLPTAPYSSPINTHHQIPHPTSSQRQQQNNSHHPPPRNIPQPRRVGSADPEPPGDGQDLEKISLYVFAIIAGIMCFPVTCGALVETGYRRWARKNNQDNLEQHQHDIHNSTVVSSQPRAAHDPDSLQISTGNENSNSGSKSSCLTLEQLEIIAPVVHYNDLIKEYLSTPINKRTSVCRPSMVCAICQYQFGCEDLDTNDDVSINNNLDDKDFLEVDEKEPGKEDYHANDTRGSIELTAALGGKVLVRRLECGHVFHSECILKWMCGTRGRCPLCNRNFINK